MISHLFKLSELSGFSKPLSTGHLSAVLQLSKRMAPLHASSVGASLNLAKITNEVKNKIELNELIGNLEYKPPKGKIIKWSLKAALRPKLFIKTLPKPIIREGLRVVKEN